MAVHSHIKTTVHNDTGGKKASGPVKPTAKKGRKQVAGGSKSKEKVDEYARDADAEPDAANNCNNNKDHDVPESRSATRAKSGKKSAGSVRTIPREISTIDDDD
jgi:hypothetical protein